MHTEVLSCLTPATRMHAMNKQATVTKGPYASCMCTKKACPASAGGRGWDVQQQEELSVPTLSGVHGRAVKDHYRVVVMGAAGVGKSCIISQFLYEKFAAEYTETVEELHRGEYEVHGQQLTLDILDTSGAFEFPAMRQLSITTGDAFVLVYSIDNDASFDEVKRLRDQIIEQKDGDEQTPIVIVGNKADVATASDRALPKVAAETTVNIDWGNGYVEASAKDNVNIIGIFKELLLQAKVTYALSPAIRRRRMSLPHLVGGGVGATAAGKKKVKFGKRHSCVIT